MKRSLLLVGLLFLSLPAFAERWLHLTLQSPDGEWVGSGQNWDVTYTDANTTPGWFRLDLLNWSGGAEPNFLRISAIQEPFTTHYLSADFGTNELGHELRPGTYLDAQRASFADPGHPGLDIGFQHRGSNTLTGQFVIDAIDYHDDGADWVLDYFRASFVQHSEGLPLALTGTIEYSAVPEPATLAAFGIGAAALLRRRRR